MNKARRKQLVELSKRVQLLKAAVENLPDCDDIKSDLEALKDDEQEAFDALPESIQKSGRGDSSAEAISQMESAINSLAATGRLNRRALNDDLQEVLDSIDSAAEGGDR